MQLHKTMRIAGVSLSAATLALLTAEGPAAAHERTFSPGPAGPGDLGGFRGLRAPEVRRHHPDGGHHRRDDLLGARELRRSSGGVRRRERGRHARPDSLEPDGDERDRVPRKGRRPRHQCRGVDRHADEPARHRHRDRLAEHEVLREGRDPDRCQRRRTGDRLRPARPQHARRTRRAGGRHLRTRRSPSRSRSRSPTHRPSPRPSTRRPPSPSGHASGIPRRNPPRRTPRHPARPAGIGRPRAGRRRPTARRVVPALRGRLVPGAAAAAPAASAVRASATGNTHR